MHQITQLLQQQENRLQCYVDAKLSELAALHLAQSQRQNRVNAFVCKPVLLRLASDILSLTLSAVKPDARVHGRSDTWSTALQEHQNFASSLNRLCNKMHCPLSTCSITACFNQIEFARNGMYEQGRPMHIACSQVQMNHSRWSENLWRDELYEDRWLTLLQHAHDYSDLECDVPDIKLAE